MRNYTSFERNEWAKLAPKNKVNITKEELTQIKSLGDVVDLTDVHEIYTSLISYLHLVYQDKQQARQAQRPAKAKTRKPASVPAAVPKSEG